MLMLVVGFLHNFINYICYIKTNVFNVGTQIFMYLFTQQGTASVKEFYNRNHRWTEGLISAAKVVGLGARFLV